MGFNLLEEIGELNSPNNVVNNGAVIANLFGLFYQSVYRHSIYYNNISVDNIPSNIIDLNFIEVDFIESFSEVFV